MAERDYQQLRACLDPRWSAARRERALDGLLQRRARVRQRRLVFATGSAALLAGAGAAALFFIWQSRAGQREKRDAARPAVATRPGPSPGATPERAPAGTDELLLRFPDGTTATRITREARLSLGQVSSTERSIQLEAGKVRFRVTPSPVAFVVRASNVTVTVLGTVFDLEREDGVLRVQVHEGKVRVDDVEGSRVLSAGENEAFALQAPPEPAQHARAPAPGVEPQRSAAAARRRHAKTARGARLGPVERWLREADAARLRREPQKALRYFTRVAVRYPRDARAPLAAFSAGRLLLHDLGRPAAAAEWFRRARALGAAGRLREDALARQVEAHGRAGETEQARALAEEYLRLHPRGQRLAGVKRWGRLE